MTQFSSSCSSVLTQTSEFIRVGYYVNIDYTEPELRETPPSPPLWEKLQRNILATNPRWSKFACQQCSSLKHNPIQNQSDQVQDQLGRERGGNWEFGERAAAQKRPQPTFWQLSGDLCVQSSINLIWQLLPLFLVIVNYDLNPLPQSMDTPLKSTNGLSASAPMEIEWSQRSIFTIM